jgi:hypothetical protein
MQHSAYLLVVASLAILAVPSAGQDHKPLDLVQKISSAKTVYFDDQTGDASVGKEALKELKKWGRFQITTDRKEADLIFLLSAEPHKGGNIVFSGGQTGSIDSSGNVQEDPIPTYAKTAPAPYAFLTVIDLKTGGRPWSGSHQWGGLLTGFNSVGARLIDKLKAQVEK